MHFMYQMRKIKPANSCASPRMEWMGRYSQALLLSLWKGTMNCKLGSKGELKSMTAVAKISLALLDRSCLGIYFNKLKQKPL